MRVWSTTDVPGRDQFAIWREVICEAFGALDPHRALPGSTPGFPAKVELTAIEAIRCATVEAPAHRVLRGRPEIRRDPQEAYFINLQLASACATRQAGCEAVVQPGDFVVLDLTGPYEIDVRPGFSILCLRVPRSRLVPWIPDPRRLGGRVGRGGTAAGRIAGSFMRHLWAESDALPASTAASLGDVLAELVNLGLGGETSHPAPRSRTAALAGAHAAIRRRLAEPGLSATSVAQELRVSVRTLHALFEGEERSFAAQVRHDRLARCAADLRNPADRRAISAIGWRWGFSDAAHFSRTFRQTYGVSPREYRGPSVSSHIDKAGKP